ncbi:MAG: branched-chain amino acid ABC transporter permease [Candidatus Hadarchaeum sp.]|uniref:branched-chain amino acid ABC transporter permease n=1 Tax=Candidatus Hadarchaeum sp. TaxID=2883567 RepID=UPI00316BB367
MVEPIVVDGIVYAALLACMTIGFTLILMSTKIWNFAYGSMATTGAYISLTAAEVWKLSIYSQLVTAFVLSGLISFALYRFLVRPLSLRGISLDGLFVLTFAFNFVLLGFLNIYADYLTNVFKLRARLFFLRGADIQIFGTPGVVIISPLLAVAIIIILHLFLTRTKFGTAMRATIENPPLAGSVGVNVNLVYSTAWFLAGGLAGLAGALLPLWILCYPNIGDVIMLSVFAASILGGIHSIYGALLGGFIAGLAEIWGTSALAGVLGSAVIQYRPLIPLIIVVVFFLTAPEGITGIEWRGKLTKRIRKV